jgi:amino acid adenylation domain-containing protein
VSQEQMSGEGFPLSPQQRRLWALGAGTAGTPLAARVEVRIAGAARRDALLEAVRDVVARHEILRTAFPTAADMTEPLQVIADTAPVVELLDPAAAAGSAAPIRLVATSEDELRLIVTLSSLCCDRRGLDNLVAAVRAAYQVRLGGAADAEQSPLQYADAAAWLNSALESEDTEAARRFWAGRRAAPPQLPFEHEASGPFEPRTSEAWPVPAAIAERLDAHWMTWACWAHLLQRLTDSPNVPTALEDDGRQYAELEDAIGVYARLLPISTPFGPESTVADAASALAQAAGEARRWADAFDCRAFQGGVAADLLWPFAFEHRRAAARADVDGVVFEPLESAAWVDRVGLKLVYHGGEAPRLQLEYDASRFAGSDVETLAGGVRLLLASAARDLSAPLSSLTLVRDGELAALCPAADESAASAAPLLSVHTAFAEWAARTPDAPAVSFENDTLTFGALNARANRLAHRLVRAGVAPNMPVGLCLDRSVDAVAGLLGILKAGGGYVPLDPRVPAARRAEMIRSAGLTLVVTRAAQTEGLTGCRLVLLDDPADPLDGESTHEPGVATASSHLAYILFTSGSTGTPKGVAVEHGHLAAYVESVRRRLDLPEQAAYATVTTMTADLGHTAIFPSLTGGGHLHVISDERTADAESFAEYAERHAIDVLKIVPSHLRALLSCQRPERVVPRRRLVLGGEACAWDLVDQVRALVPECRVFNHYGPTETTVGAVAGEIPPQPHHAGAAVPLGTPLAHASAYVLDAARRPVPIWFPGELFIGGGAVARGYINPGVNPATESPFLADPFAGLAGGRMYRTGDRVRRLGDGALEFLGRADDQVKIRGFRVEPGEIEAVLREHPSVHEASVLVRQSESGDKSLVAFVSGILERPDVAALRALVAARLPEHMMPASFVPVSSIPRTANGKTDRAALLAAATAAAARTASGTGAAPLTSEWERAVATVWSELLQVAEVGPQDNFYDLGGHSLMAIQVVTAIEKRHGVRVAARELVFHTLRQFAALCESRQAGASSAR